MKLIVLTIALALNTWFAYQLYDLQTRYNALKELSDTRYNELDSRLSSTESKAMRTEEKLDAYMEVKIYGR